MANNILNNNQQLAVNHIDGPCFVCANPGSGKTFVIVNRTVSLINLGIDPKSILCVTFTNKAAEEMRERISFKIGEKGDSIYISTFHSLCANILKKLGSSLGYNNSFVIYDSNDSIDLIVQASRQLGYKYNRNDLKILLYGVNTLRENLIEEKYWYEKCEISKKIIPREDQIKIMLLYKDKLLKNNSIDFSGLLSETIRLLKTDKEVLLRLQTRFQYIQIDETQDTNYCQFELIRLLGLESHKNVFIVGDKNQTIYQFRNARYKNIENFIKDYNSRIIYLSENYRSTPEIIKVASSLIKHNKDAKDMKFITNNNNGEDVLCFEFYSPDYEANWIANKIKYLIDNKGYEHSDIAILYRINSMSRALELAMNKNGIKYSVIGGLRFFDRAEIKDILSMLKFYINPNDGISFERFINKPAIGIGPVTLGKIEIFAQEHNIDLIKAIERRSEYLNTYECKNANKIYKKFMKILEIDRENMSIGEIVEQFINDWDYKEFLESKYKDEKELEDRQKNITELMSYAHIYSEKNGNDISSYLNLISLSSNEDKQETDNKISLMTIHSSKGLEFSVVFMPRMENDMLPFARTVHESPTGLEEERRLCYVGVSRCKERLFLSYSGNTPIRNGYTFSMKKNSPSIFFEEMEILDQMNTVETYECV